MSCKKNTYCLNNKEGKKILLDYVNNTFKGKNSTSFKNYSFYLNDNSNHEFKINCSYKKDIDDKKKLYLNIYSNEKKYCLKYELKNKKKHSKYSLYFGFKKSFIHNINKNLCGVKKKKYEMLSGTYILKLVEKIDKLFEVEISELDDDSRIELCGSSATHLKIIKLMEYGQTWYEKEGGYKLKNKEIYKLTEEIRKIKLNYLYNDIYENDFNRELLEFKLKKEDIEKTIEILKKVKLNLNNTLKDISKIFKSTIIDECEKLHIWENVYSLPKRKKLLIKDEKNFDLYKKYYNFQKNYILLRSEKIY